MLEIIMICYFVALLSVAGLSAIYLLIGIWSPKIVKQETRKGVLTIFIKIEIWALVNGAFMFLVLEPGHFAEELHFKSNSLFAVLSFVIGALTYGIFFPRIARQYSDHPRKYLIIRLGTIVFILLFAAIWIRDSEIKDRESKEALNRQIMELNAARLDAEKKAEKARLEAEQMAKKLQREREELEQRERAEREARENQARWKVYSCYVQYSFWVGPFRFNDSATVEVKAEDAWDAKRQAGDRYDDSFGVKCHSLD